MPARHARRTPDPSPRRGGSGASVALLGALVCIAVGVGIGYLAFSGPKTLDSGEDKKKETFTKKEMVEFAEEKYEAGMKTGREREQKAARAETEQKVAALRNKLDAEHRAETDELKQQIENLKSGMSEEQLDATQTARDIAYYKNTIADLEKRIEEIKNAPPVPMIVVVSPTTLAVINTNAERKMSGVKITATDRNGTQYTYHLYDIAAGKFATFRTSEMKFQDKKIGAVRQSDGLKFTIAYKYKTDDTDDTDNDDGGVMEDVEPIFAND